MENPRIQVHIFSAIHHCHVWKHVACDRSITEQHWMSWLLSLIDR